MLSKDDFCMFIFAVTVDYITINKYTFVLQWFLHTCQLSLFNRNCPYFDPRKRVKKKSYLTMCPYFCKNLSLVMYRKFRNVPIFKIFLPFVPYFFGFRVGKYVFVVPVE